MRYDGEHSGVCVLPCPPLQRNVPHLSKEGCKGLAQFIDYREHPSEKVIYLCMEYVSESNLLQFIREDCASRWSDAQFITAVTMLHKVAKDMTIIHEKGVAHRDLTLENIMVDEKNLEILFSMRGKQFCGNGQLGIENHKKKREFCVCSEMFMERRNSPYRAPKLSIGELQ